MVTEIDPTHWRTLWISDLHLGSTACSAESLLDFLDHHDADTLYLVGDIVDAWHLKRFGHWPRAHNDVVQRILRRARNGTRVVLIPGRRDPFVRDWAGVSFGDIDIVEEAIHRMACGRRLLVTHGDQFDSRWTTRLAGIYHTVQRWRDERRNPEAADRASDAREARHQRGRAGYLRQVQHVGLNEVRRRMLDGLICGHAHAPALETVDGLIYGNDGDWVHSLSAIAEDHDGRLSLQYGQPQARRLPLSRDATRPLAMPALPSTLRR